MTGRVALAALVAALVVPAAGAVAPPGQPDVASLLLTPADVPGGKVAEDGRISDPGTVGAYSRSFTFARPRGRSKLVLLQAVAELETSVAVARGEYRSAQRDVSTPARRKAFAVTLLKALGGNPRTATVVVGAPRGAGAGEQSFELVARFTVGPKHSTLVVDTMRVDRVLVVHYLFGQAATASRAESRVYLLRAAARVRAALVPILITPPTVSGSAQQGNTLTAAPGAWGDVPTGYAYRWQRCNATATTCTDVPGAAARTYLVQPGDAGFALRVQVTARNRFGAVTEPSALTSVVA